MTAIVPKQVRARLTLWHVGMLAGVLAVYLGGVSLLLFWQAGNILKRIAAEDLETLKGLLFVADDGQVGVREDYHHHTDWKQVQERLLEILGPDGSVLYRNERLGERGLGGPPFAGEGENGYSGRTARMFRAAASGSNSTAAARSILVMMAASAVLKMVGYFSGLSSPSVTESRTTRRFSPRS